MKSKKRSASKSKRTSSKRKKRSHAQRPVRTQARRIGHVQSARHPMLNDGGEVAVNLYISNSDIHFSPARRIGECAVRPSGSRPPWTEVLLATIDAIKHVAHAAIHAMTWHLAIKVVGAILLSVLLLAIYGDLQRDEGETQDLSTWVLASKIPQFI